MSSVFIIINEWTDVDQDFECIHGDQYWTSQAGALAKLNQIADSFGVAVPDGETSFDADVDCLERDIYYIRELTRG